MTPTEFPPNGQRPMRLLQFASITTASVTVIISVSLALLGVEANCRLAPRRVTGNVTGSRFQRRDIATERLLPSSWSSMSGINWGVRGRLGPGYVFSRNHYYGRHPQCVGWNSRHASSITFQWNAWAWPRAGCRRQLRNGRTWARADTIARRNILFFRSCRVPETPTTLYFANNRFSRSHDPKPSHGRGTTGCARAGVKD